MSFISAFQRVSLLTLLLTIATSTQLQARTERKLYVGTNSTEAVLEFDGEVQIESRGALDKETINDKISSQVNHLFGPMGEARYKAVPRGNESITKVSEPTAVSGSSDVFEVSYHYKGTIVLQNGPVAKYVVTLPVNPDTIYAASGKVHGKNPCTDDHYNDEGDFWYFWNPENVGCKLREGVDFLRIEGNVARLANTKLSYPEYARLIRTTDSGKEIIMSAFLGMDDPSKNRNPLKSTDINASNYRAMRNSLVKMGFKVSAPWTAKESESFLGHKLSDTPFVEEFTKKAKKAMLRVRMFFGPTGIDEQSTSFHYFYKDALENSSLMTYDGHSGLGGHLDLEALEQNNAFKIDFDKQNYQIFYFNSCTSYTYYNTQYFKRKVTAADRKGTKNLDIMTNGLATLFSVMHDTNMAVVKAIADWADGKATTSYQALAKKIDSNNLFGVNGDEDNVKQ